MAILIIEDHAMFREVLVMVAQDKAGLEVCAAVGTGREGLAAFGEHRPQMVVLDLDLPDMDGLLVADAIQSMNNKANILAVSSRIDEYTLYRVLRSGFMGFADKTNQNLDELAQAMKSVSNWTPSYSTSALQNTISQQADPNAFPKLLSGREQELLCLFGVGLRNEDIAERLGLSPSTVQSHRRNIMSKLSIESTPELIRYAMKKGFARVSRM